MNLEKHFKTVLILFLIFAFHGQAKAEYNHELGITGGTTFYLGDANHVTVFNRPLYAFGGLYRYNIDTRWALKVSVMYAKVEGDTRDFGYILPNHQDYAAFEREFVDASLVVEFNFLDIGESGYYKGTYKVTPYILLGVGLTAYNNMYTAENMYNFNIPFGIGGKWKIDKRWTLGLEWTIHKLFTDSFDVTDSSNSILNDPYNTGHVGFFDTDWYSFANLYISFNLFNTRKFCR